MKKLFLLALLCAPMAFAQTAVSGTNVLDNNGNLLASGDWNFGGTAIAVTTGAFSGTVTPGTQTVTVTNGGTTYLTVPSVVIGSSAFNWNTYVVPTNASISGMGSPRIACAPGASYSQTDSSPSGKVSTCYNVNGVNIWLPEGQAGGNPSGQYAGAGVPTFSCTSPCTYIRSDAPTQTSALYAIVAAPGASSTNWQLQSGAGNFSAAGDLSGSNTSQEVIGLKGVPFCSGFTPTNGQLVQYTTGGSPNPCYAAATVSGSFTPGGDLSGNSSSQEVIGIHSVPLCTGFTPTNGQVLQYTTGSSPNPCYTAVAQPSTPSSVGLGSVSNAAQTLASVMPNTAPASAQVPIGNPGGTAYAPQTISVDISLANNGHATVQGIEGVPFCSGFSPTNGQFVQYTTGGTPNPCYGAASTSGSFTAGGDLSGSSTSQEVVGIHSVPLCTGFTPTNGQVLQYTTGSSPNPCYTAATSVPPNGSASGDLSGSYPGPTVAQIEGAAIPASANGVSTNSLKQMIAQTAHNQSVIAGCTTTNTGNTYSCTTTPTFTPAAGDQILVDFNAANTGSATLNVNSTSAVNIYKWGNTATLASGDLQSGHYIRATYDGTHWQLEGQLGNANANQVNGATVPASSSLMGSNSSSQLVTESAHAVAATIICADSSGSGTAQSCSTTPSFTPVTNDCLLYTTTTTNSGTGLTTNINSLGAKSIAIPGFSGWTTTLTASIIPANKPIHICYDGTNWDVVQTGTLASSGGTGQAGEFTSVSFSATPTFTASSNTVNAWTITLTGNVTGSMLASSAAGQYLSFNICQDSTGSRTFTWPTGFSAATTVFPTASTCTTESFFWDGTNAHLLAPAQVSGASLSALWYGPTGSAPATPTSGYIAAWFDSTDNALKVKNSSGTVTAAVSLVSCTNQVVTAISDNAADTCTTLTLASAYFANQGTTTTVLHGAASGNPSFGAVVLSTDVSGTLPQANLSVISVVVDTSTPVTASTTLPTEQHFNENATAGAAVTYDLPTASAGKQFCFSNAYNGTAANTGTLTLQTSAAGQYIIFTDGTLSASDGYVISGGAARDSACVVGVDSTHWALYVQVGTWTKH